MAGSPFPRDLLRAATVGLNLVAATFVGLLIGLGLDKLFNTRPWLTVVFLILGIVSGFRELFKFARGRDNGPDSADKDR